MTDLTEKTPDELEPTLPEGRVTMRQVAEYVGAEIKTTKRELRAEQKSLKQEMRWWLATFAAFYQFHLDLTFLGVAAGGYFAWTKILPRLPFLNR